MIKGDIYIYIWGNSPGSEGLGFRAMSLVPLPCSNCYLLAPLMAPLKGSYCEEE